MESTPRSPVGYLRHRPAARLRKAHTVSWLRGFEEESRRWLRAAGCRVTMSLARNHGRRAVVGGC